MALLLVFIECLPEEFLACQSISMVDRSTQMPPQAFENVKVIRYLLYVDPACMQKQASYENAFSAMNKDCKVRPTRRSS